jgi:hypothetical protein
VEEIVARIHCLYNVKLKIKRQWPKSLLIVEVIGRASEYECQKQDIAGYATAPQHVCCPPSARKSSVIRERVYFLPLALNALLYACGKGPVVWKLDLDGIDAIKGRRKNKRSALEGRVPTEACVTANSACTSGACSRSARTVASRRCCCCCGGGSGGAAALLLRCSGFPGCPVAAEPSARAGFVTARVCQNSAAAQR